MRQHLQEAEAEGLEGLEGLELPRKARKKRRSSTSKGKTVGKLSPFQASGEIWEVEPIFYGEIWDCHGSSGIFNFALSQ